MLGSLNEISNEDPKNLPNNVCNKINKEIIKQFDLKTKKEINLINISKKNNAELDKNLFDLEEFFYVDKNLKNSNNIENLKTNYSNNKRQILCYNNKLNIIDETLKNLKNIETIKKPTYNSQFETNNNNIQFKNNFSNNFISLEICENSSEKNKNKISDENCFNKSDIENKVKISPVKSKKINKFNTAKSDCEVSKENSLKRKLSSRDNNNNRNNNQTNNNNLKKLKFDKKSVISEMSSMYDKRYQENGLRSHENENSVNINASSNQYYHPSIQNPPNIATLCNIGNTCYLNSVVYTLRFAPLFLHNLHHLIDDLTNINQKLNKNRMKSSSLGRNITGLQMENTRSWSSKDLSSLEQNNFYPGTNNFNTNCKINSSNVLNNTGNGNLDLLQKSNQQINVIDKLHELYQNLHRNEVLDSVEPFHADTFLHAVQGVSSIFEGNQQQDAHEFLMCVLDNLRESCQALIKSITECPNVLSNGHISLPERKEIIPTTSNAISLTAKEQLSHLNSNISNTASQATSLIKNSFFSRKSKRKDESRNSKNIRLQSPLKDNTQQHQTLNKINCLNDNPIKIKNTNCSETSSSTQNILSKELLNERIKSLGLDFFSEDFEGITVSTTKCLSCETITEQKETMIDIAVPISQYENFDFSDKSQSFIQNSCITREYFRGENKYRCEQCIGYTEAIRSISYEVLPRLLVIQLSRFSGGMEKINSYLPTPFTLQCFCSKCFSEKEDKLHVYKLYSVITHVGATMSVGHYIAYVLSSEYLDETDEYLNCLKDHRKQQQKIDLSVSNNLNSTATNNSNILREEKSSNGLMKKIFYGRSKASSSGDMSKAMKNINLSNTNTSTSANVNGAQSNTAASTCHGSNCCGTKLKIQNNLQHQGLIQLQQNNHSVMNSNISYNDWTDNSTDNKGVDQSLCEPIWYMCDDDKIKAMTQSEFEDLLSPNRKIMITPYLLFYARKNCNVNKNSK